MTHALGEPIYARTDAPATPAQKTALARSTAEDLLLTELAGEPISSVVTTADGQSIGGIKVSTEHGGWFAARPSGTEDTGPP